MWRGCSKPTEVYTAGEGRAYDPVSLIAQTLERVPADRDRGAPSAVRVLGAALVRDSSGTTRAFGTDGTGHLRTHKTIPIRDRGA